MKNVKVVGVSPKVLNIREVESHYRNHFEAVEFGYEEISWKYADGNMIFKDAWSYI
ncbi:hypothetical protein K788_0000980 [Paraburkholderia caribensis MBA4]|uniref:Uncharacterized protein n=2 Tax=Paraburkholderia caribensis TaxID=75105 RepID=A0A0P0RH50_9BURK|nr:hypothetical protein K788_0000980 [Paraburkholderia caribensis MBA4]